MKTMKTLSVKQSEVRRAQHVIDASNKVLGRLAAEVAVLLQGKHKPLFSRNIDCGDFVTVINCEKIQVTGKKAVQKMYYWHSNYPGGFKQRSYKQIMEEHPTRIIEYAVLGMLPYNRLRDRVIKRLKVYPGALPEPVVKPKKEKKAPPPKKSKAKETDKETADKAAPPVEAKAETPQGEKKE